MRVVAELLYYNIMAVKNRPALCYMPRAKSQNSKFSRKIGNAMTEKDSSSAIDPKEIEFGKDWLISFF